jgi:hypothetical protein
MEEVDGEPVQVHQSPLKQVKDLHVIRDLFLVVEEVKESTWSKNGVHLSR